jgi:PAS domain S-box-containing protein
MISFSGAARRDGLFFNVSPKNSESHIREILDFLSSLESGDFSESLNHPEEPGILNPIIDKLNKLSQTLAAQAQLSIVLDSVPGILFSLSIEGNDRFRFRWANKAFLDATGLRENLVIGKLAEEVLPPASLKMVLEKYKEAVRTGRVVRWEETSEYPTGIKQGAVSISPVFDEKGVCTHLLGIVHDITERKKFEDRLRQSEYRLAEAQQVGKLGSWETDLSTLVVKWSLELFRMFEIDPGSFQPSHSGFLAFVHPDDRARVDAAFVGSFEKRSPNAIEHRIVTDSGCTTWVEERWQIFHDDKGLPVRAVGTCQNINERKLAETALNDAKNTAEQANRTKDFFLATLSHELRTPLTAILSWSQLIKNRKLDAAAEQRGVEAIEQSALNQSRLINDLLDVSRIASGKLLLDCHDISPIAAIHSQMDTFASAAAEKQIEIIRDIDLTVTKVFADQARLHQILSNLLTNALKFTARGGKIWVTLRRAGSFAELVIRDNGVGIAPDFLDHIFSRFSQADSSSTRSHGGLGLGLAISSSLVKMMGGTIKAESPGKGLGATFAVQLPIQVLAIQPESTEDHRLTINLVASQPSSEEVNRIKGMKILCVDDDAPTLEAIKTVLELYGADVKSALSAKQALDIFKDFTADLVISDIAMPEMDGYGLFRSIRSLPSQKAKPTPVVALTAYAGPEDQKRVTEAGLQGYLTKPVDANILLQTVARFKKKAAT